MEIIFEFVIIWLISYPAALIRWAVTGFKKNKFKEYVMADSYLNLFIFSLTVLFVFLVVKFIRWIW